MPVLATLNFSPDPSQDFTDEDEIFLIAAFNRLPQNITAENIATRKHRAFLISCTEDLNITRAKGFDFLDVLLKLQQLRKAGRLR